MPFMYSLLLRNDLLQINHSSYLEQQNKSGNFSAVPATPKPIRGKDHGPYRDETFNPYHPCYFVIVPPRAVFGNFSQLPDRPAPIPYCQHPGLPFLYFRKCYIPA
jgi:hypothetical protein